jgi:hypothetical protein
MVAPVSVDPRQVERNRLLWDLSWVLNGLMSDYRKVIKLGRKYPGAMPINVTAEVFESKLTNVRTRLATM